MKTIVVLFGALVMLAGCATGPSKYAAENPDSYLIKAIHAAGMTPEGVQQQISSIVQAEIAMGTFTREDALNYMAGLEVYLNDGASYADAKALAERYMMRYMAKSDPISHAAVLAYYVFKPKLNIPDLGMPIVEADRKVLQDLFAAVRADLGEPTSSVDEFRKNLRASMLENRIQFEIDHASEIADLKTGANQYLVRMAKVQSDLGK